MTMIDDMASLKRAMEQMDAQDTAVAEAAKARAARILDDSKMSFSKMAELIEQRRLLLRPKIVASIKHMDEPDMLGDAAFRDAGYALRRDGQSFRQIAEAIELIGGPAPRYEDPVQTSEALHQMELADEPVVPAWLSALAFVVNIVFFPVRHPLRFFTIALLAFVLFNTLRGFVGFGQQISGFVDGVAGARQRVDRAVSSVSSFVDKRLSGQSQEAAPPPSAAPIPSPPTAAPSPQVAASPSATAPSPPPAASSTASTAPTSAPAPSANEAASAPPSTAPAAPAASTPNLDARAIPSARIRRNSRIAGPCIGGVGGCYWGGNRY
jgi:hypothetical protein